MTAGASRLSKMLTLLLLIATCVYALPTEYDDQWEAWKTEYNKVYKDDIEEAHRKEIWMKHLVYVQKHNAQSDVHGYTLAMNLFADLVSFITIITLFIVERSNDRPIRTEMRNTYRTTVYRRQTVRLF